MNANGTTEFSELTHAGQCLDIYLHNTAEIYARYTVPAIGQAVDCIKDNARCMSRPDFYEVIAAMATTFGAVKSAVYEAGRLVERYDRMKLKAKDIEQVTRNYAAYIVDCAKYEIEQ